MAKTNHNTFVKCSIEPLLIALYDMATVGRDCAGKADNDDAKFRFEAIQDILDMALFKGNSCSSCGIDNLLKAEATIKNLKASLSCK